MPFSSTTVDRERDKFVENPAGQTSVRTLVSNEAGQEIPVSFPNGVSVYTLSGPLKRRVVTVTDTAANPIAVPLADRVSLIIRNKDLVNAIYLGEDNTITADNTATGGWEIGPGEDFSIDIRQSEVFYLIAPPGQSVVVKILEIAAAI